MAGEKSQASPSHAKQSDGKGNEPETGAGAATHGTGAAPVDPNATDTTHDREHVSGYGGHGGAPKTGSDKREPHRPD